MKRLYSFRRLLLLSILLLVGLTACEQTPTDAGLDLVEQQGGDPLVVTIDASRTVDTTFADLTGQRGRVLVGTVADPLFGAVTATGYFDLLSASASDDFREGTVSAANLQLVINYVYGDTTQPVTITLHALNDELEGVADATADTTITPGSIIPLSAEASTILPTDSLITIPLPASWIDANDATLRSEAFADEFHGFQLTSAAGNAVVGFNLESSRLQVVAEEDTVSYPAARRSGNQLFVGPNLTTIDKTPPASLPENRLAVQDGAGTTFRFTLPLADSLLNSSLNRGAIQLRADTVAAQQQTPPNFVRPPLREFLLYGVRGESEEALMNARLDDEGVLVFDTRQSALLFSILQNILLGTDTPYDAYRLGVPFADQTINTQLFYGPAESEQVPNLRLSLVPLGEQ